VSEAAVNIWDGPTMDVALKIWRVDEDGERELKTYEVEAPEWACLLDVLDIIDGLRERYARGVVVEDKGQVFNTDLTQAIELGFLLEIAACMLQAGVARKESRGAHSRPHDYPTRDDENFLKHSITRWNADGDAPVLSYKPVRMTQWEPMERKY